VEDYASVLLRSAGGVLGTIEVGNTFPRDGTDAEINSRLWDVAADGSATLVTRAAYRWTGSPGVAAISYSLQGSGWSFAVGHTLRIQVTQNDAPYLRLDNYPSSISYSSMALTLPVVASPGC